MKIRTKCPEKNNKYYNNKRHGGLSDAVNGDPMIKGLTVLDNCVGWANSRFNEIINDPNLTGIVKAFRYQLVCNAENFIESAKRQGLKISKTPIQGGIMVWQKGRTLGGGDGAGHVAVVEEVYDDGTILTSESGYRAWTFKTIRRSNDNGRWGQNSNYKFRGCIINPAVTNAQAVEVPKLAVDGIGGENTVRAMQRFFGTPQDGVISGQRKSLNKYYPSLIAVEYGKGGSVCIKRLQKWVGTSQDGVLGQQTVKAWQKKLGVTADGIFGENSMRAWQEYLNEHDADPLQAWFDAMKTQFNWSKNQRYHFNDEPTVANSKKEGTCITFPAVSLQRLGMIPKGEYFYFHPDHKRISGPAADYVKKHKELYALSYPNKTLKQLRKEGKVKKGDIVGFGNPGYHTMVYMGTDKDGNSIFNTMGHKRGLSVNYSSYAKRKVNMLVRIKKLK